MLISLLAIIGYVFILITAFLRRGQREVLGRYLALFLFVSIVWEFALVLLPQALYPPHIDVLILLMGTLMLGLITAVYTDWPHQKWWLIGGGVLFTLALALSILLPVQTFLLFNFSVPFSNLAVIVAWLAMSLWLLGKTWLDYKRTALPWHANRLLYWTIALFAIFLGEALIYLEGGWSVLAGQIVRFTGAAAIAHALSAHRVFDVRTRSLNVFASLLVTILSATPLGVAIMLVQSITRSQQSFLFATIVVISLSFLVYQPFRAFIERFVYRYLPGNTADPREVVRNYSQAVYQILDVQQLSLAIISALNELMGIDRGALVLLTKVDEGYEIEPIPGAPDVPRTKLQFPFDTLLIQAVMNRQQPLLQYDLDFSPQFRDLSPEIRAWLKEMEMELFVPIGAGSNMAGFIAVGPKRSGVPYQANELELVQILADQTVIALQNARLYSELNDQNDNVRHLNLDLVAQNERLAVMDKVKADFITIASHELRTPLTQVKGYADILSAMNESEALTPKQTQEILSHINRAVKRLETLITAMLDASQLDAEGVQLSFMDTSLDTVVRIAIEPMADAVKDRRITITRDSLTEIPSIRADFKRLVQAFSNLIGNAIKYTPDHGQITISATMVADQNDEESNVQIVIADTGIGIDPKYHDLIFEKFFRIGDPQLHSTGTTKFKGAGPGLGLTIAKGVVEAHDGRIWVESEREDEDRLPGSRFYIILPLKPPGSEVTANTTGNSETTERPSWLIG